MFSTVEQRNVIWFLHNTASLVSDQVNSVDTYSGEDAAHGLAWTVRELIARKNPCPKSEAPAVLNQERS